MQSASHKGNFKATNGFFPVMLAAVRRCKSDVKLEKNARRVGYDPPFGFQFPFSVQAN
jgi:hypothetical protein